MRHVRRSKLFKDQLLDMTASYRERAGSAVALRFVDQVEDGVDFIADRPQACAVYTRLQDTIFRKWRLKAFPVSLFFRIDKNDVIVLEALYAHRMNIDMRLPHDTQDED